MGHTTNRMVFSPENLIPSGYLLQFAMGAMAHRNRWFTELKNGDFPIKHGDFPMKNGGSFPLKMMDLSH